MTPTQARLWAKILAFELDDTDSSFKFSDRLARENSWSLEFAIRAIQEYKKFIFLICTSNTPKTPSDAVDQVWHLHLLYTQSYWVDFCKETLNRDIHHGPTKGAEQRGDFKKYYADTKSEYTALFEEIPPKDIWPSDKIRFGQINFTRVNRHKFWIIPKLKPTK